MEEHGTVKGRRRHVFVWKALRPLAKLICWIKFGFTCEKTNVKGPYLLVSNHVTNWDPILVACSFPEQTYFVTSEHLAPRGTRRQARGMAPVPHPPPEERQRREHRSHDDALSPPRDERVRFPGGQPHLGRRDGGVSPLDRQARALERRVARHLQAHGRILRKPPLGGQLHPPREDARRGRARILPRGAARDEPAGNQRAHRFRSSRGRLRAPAEKPRAL